jgi:aryl-alcohol dehydrogenase-like predicted oxidoreductase
METDVIPLCQEYGLGLLPWSRWRSASRPARTGGVADNTRLSSPPALAKRPDFASAITRTAELQKVADVQGCLASSCPWPG